MRKTTPPPRSGPKRYQGGGSVTSSSVDPNYMSKLVNQGFDTTRNAIGMANAVKSLMNSSKPDASPAADTSMTGGAGGGNPTAGARKGGPIRKTYGPKLGREDGVIAAQRGEYVIRKSAAQKLGTKMLNKLNKGQLPKGSSRGR